MRLKIGKKWKAAGLNSKFTGFYKQKSVTELPRDLTNTNDYQHPIVG